MLDDKTVDMMDFSANSNVTAIFHTFSTPVVWNEADSKEEKAKCKKICIYGKIPLKAEYLMEFIY